MIAPPGRIDAMETTLVLLSGIPGTGKSAIAEALARRLAIPVFALDWILGAVMPLSLHSAAMPT